MFGSLNTALPAFVTLVTVLGHFILRGRHPAIRAAFAIVMLCVGATVMIGRKLSPIAMGAPPGLGWFRVMVMVWWLLAGRLAVFLVRLAIGLERSREARLASDLAAGGIYAAVALIILNEVLGLPITGVLATSGVIAIVLGMALQNTLADLFSGVAVGVDHPFGVGDRVAIKDHVEGVVIQVNWRSIRIRTDDEDVATIPNTIVAKSQILNRNLPSDRRVARIEVHCPAAGDPEHVVSLLAHAALLTQGILESPPAAAFFIRAGLRTNSYEINFHVAALKGLPAIRTRLQVNVRRQLRQAGILRSRHDAGDSPAARLSAVQVLGEVTLFESLEPDQLQHLADRLRLITLAPGDLLFAEGDRDPLLHLMLSGVLEVSTRDDQGGQRRVGRLGAGEHVGEVALLTETPRRASARALTYCELYEIPRDALKAVVSDCPELLPAMERSVVRSLELLESRAAREVSAPIQRSVLFRHLRVLFGKN